MKIVLSALMILSIALLLLTTLSVSKGLLEDLLGFKLESPSYYLIVGKDKNIEGTSRADVIIVAGINSEKGRVMLLSVPRDLEINGRRINSYLNDGIESLRKVVEEILEVEINGYAIFDYESFVVLGNELGPVRVTVKSPMVYVDEAQKLKINFMPGVHELYGKELLAYIRYRKGGMGDLDRIRREKEVLSILLKKLLSLSVSRALDVTSKVLNYVETNLTLKEIAAILFEMRKGISLSFLQLPVLPREDGTVVLDEEKLPKIIKALKEFETEEENGNYRIVLVNGKKNKTKYFRPIEEKRWLLQVGFKPYDILWEDIGFVTSGSTILICTSDPKAEKEIYEIVSRVYPHRNFELMETTKLEGAEIYYEIVEKALKIRRFLKRPIDALVILGEVR